MGNVLAGERSLLRQAGFREVSQVGDRVNIGDGLGEAIAAVQAEAVREALLQLKRPAVINGGATAELDEEIAELREQSLARTRRRSITHDGFARLAGNRCTGCWHCVADRRVS